MGATEGLLGVLRGEGQENKGGSSRKSGGVLWMAGGADRARPRGSETTFIPAIPDSTHSGPYQDRLAQMGKLRHGRPGAALGTQRPPQQPPVYGAPQARTPPGALVLGREGDRDMGYSRPRGQDLGREPGKASAPPTVLLVHLAWLI